MDEGTIYCVADSAIIEDLDLSLYRGQSVRVPLDRFDGSSDLRKARSMGLVSVSLPKTMAVKSPDPLAHGNVRAVSRAAVSPIPLAVVDAPKPTHIQPPTILDMGPVLGVLQQILEELKYLRSEIAKRPIGTTGSLAPTGSNHEPSMDGVPTFIPSIQTDGVGTVNVQTTAGTPSGSIDEAMELLRSKKEKRK